MSRNTATVTFQALEIKGSLLPASLLEEVSKLERPKELLLEASDYGLARGERLRDRIDAAWVLIKELWKEYRNLEERAGKSIAGQHFGIRLLREVFGWSEIKKCDDWRQGESSYAINHRAFEGSVPLILKGISENELDTGSVHFGQEGRKRSPHSCLQECLNGDDKANWGMIFSGDRLRLLHDNPSLVKPAYLAADLELLIEGERFDEFSVLWLLLHASRFQHPQNGSCVLDSWKQKAEASGERVLGALRGGVQSALESLGSGFLNHPANGELRDALFKHNTLSTQHFHEQLLRLVYRFLFLFTAEDRGLLFPRDLKAVDPRRRIYREGYSVSRLRELAIKRSAYEGEYSDLWELQRLVFQQLSIGNSPLGLPGLGGLFSLQQCPDLQSAELWNGPLLRAIKAIGWFDAGGTFTRVRYRDLNTEELGSVYESLLELHPQMEQQGSQWQLSYGGGAGSDRKTTGSYYTPDALVQELIKSALIPVIEDRLSKASNQAEQEKALLDIKVIDPACGSGHFLLAAARRIAVTLAQVRAGEDQPSEELRQECLRDVVARCIYAVDKNPMAVELCKVALWIEAIDPGKPLSFLDAHIQCGDSLVGVFDPKVLEEGIPDDAYKQLTGDDKTVCSSLKKENAAARKTSSRRGSNRGIQGSLDLSGTTSRSRSQEVLQSIEAMPEANLAESATKQAAYANWLEQSGQDPDAFAADLFTAAFFLAKTSASRATVPTTEHLLRLLGERQPVEEVMEKAITQVARSLNFFHWHLRFGKVMSEGGFGCVLGNPPWEMPQLQELEFFAKFPEVASASGAERKRLIEVLLDKNPVLAYLLNLQKRFFSALSNYAKTSEKESLIRESRKPNLFSMFAERLYRSLGQDGAFGSAGVILPTNLFTDEGSSRLAADMVLTGRLVSCFDFSNRERIFKNIQPNLHFSLITLFKNRCSSEGLQMACHVTDTEDLQKLENRLYHVSPIEAKRLNPITASLPICACRSDVDILLKIHSVGDLAKIEVKQGLFNMTSDSKLFTKLKNLTDQAHLVPLYESKNIGMYDSRYADFKGMPISDIYSTRPATRKLSQDEKVDSGRLLQTRYFIDKERVEDAAKNLWGIDYFIVARTILSTSQDSRSVRSTIIPRAGIGHSLAIITPESAEGSDHLFTLGNMNSLIIDYCAKKKISGANLNGFMIKQLPLLDPKSLQGDDVSFVASRVALLLATNGSQPPALHKYARVGNEASPVKEAGSTSAEVDAYFAFLYKLTRDELRYILEPKDALGPICPSETFRVLKNTEIREYGEYRTQRLVLEAWDRLFGS